jgi:precorrin-6A/cobalt-precorrin-6A reductase
MILLLGGTSDAAPIAMRLAQEGYRVLISQATDVPLETARHDNIEFRTGPLDDRGLAAVIEEYDIRAIVDAAHPYAATVHAAASRVAGAKGIPCLCFVRPAVVSAASPGVELVADHAAAAVAAFRRGRPVLLTTGTRNLAPYVAESRNTGQVLVVRVLDHPHSLNAGRQAGIQPQQIIAGRGPFSVDENRRHIRAFTAGVLVTKDSGTAGGTIEKLEAARAEGCEVVVIARPAWVTSLQFAEVDALLAAVTAFDGVAGA